MILEYHRPKLLEQALELLNRPDPPTVPLGGGTSLSQRVESDFAVVDLQALGLNQICLEGMTLRFGAAATLTQVIEEPATPEAMKIAIKKDANLNQRNAATLAGTIVCGTGQSLLLAVLLAADARMFWLPGEHTSSVGEYLASRTFRAPGKLISDIQLGLQCKLQFDYVARTPMDWPMVSVAVARWPSGRTRLVVGGSALAPILAMDGSEPGGAVEASINACSQLSTQWCSSEYLHEITKTLTTRILGS